MEDFLIAADLLESKGFLEPAMSLRYAAQFESQTCLIFEVETNLPSLMVEAARIYSKQITLAKFTQVVFSVKHDHETRGFSLVLRAGTCSSEGSISQLYIENVEWFERSEIVDRILRLIVELNLQERLLEFAGVVNQLDRFDGIVSDALDASFTVGNSLASEDEI